MHFHGDAHGRQTGALAASGLQQVEPLVVDGEFEVLHVVEVPFQRVPYGLQLPVDPRHVRGEFLDGPGRADTGDHVLALGIQKVFAVEGLLPVGRVAGKSHAGGAVAATVAEYHGLDVDGRPPGARNAVALAVEDRAFVGPRPEHGADGTPKLLVDILRERRAEPGGDEVLVVRDQPNEELRIEFRILLDSRFPLQAGEHLLERIRGGFGLGTHAEHDTRVHVNEPAIAVVGETRIARRRCQTLHGLVVEPEVQDRVHHPRHRLAGTGTHRHQERVHRVAEALALGPLQHGQLLAHGIGEPGRVVPVVLVVPGADIRGDRETRRHGQSDAGHLGEVRTLAAEQVPHAGVSVGTLAEREHVLGWLARHCSGGKRLQSMNGFTVSRSPSSGPFGYLSPPCSRAAPCRIPQRHLRSLLVPDFSYNGTITLSSSVKDLDASIAWFKDVLGFEEEFKVAEAGWAEVSTPAKGVSIGLDQTGADVGAPGVRSRYSASSTSTRPGPNSKPRVFSSRATPSSCRAWSSSRRSSTPTATGTCSPSRWSRAQRSGDASV